jgi:hypothetical protein
MPIMKVGMVSDGWVKDADKVDGFHASQTPQANTIPVAGSTGKLDAGWLPTTGGNFNVVEFTSSGNWNVPSGVTKIMIIATGGGGGGGGSASDGSAKGGTAGVGTFTVVNVSSGETLTITIGAGGAGGASGGNAGGNGGSTSIVGSVSGILISLAGGLGGHQRFSNTTYSNVAMDGASGIFGRGGQGSASGPGENAPTYGAGGGGSRAGGVGGNGGSGFVRIIYFA